MEAKGVLEAARAVRPYLPELVGPDAGRADRRIADLLAAAGLGEDVAAELWSVLTGTEAIAAFVVEVLDDAPYYRPPEWQPSNPRGGGLEHLPGPAGPVQHAGKYACPQGDYVWYRAAVGTPVPQCPTHGSILVRR
jgi:hypothetical protein